MGGPPRKIQMNARPGVDVTGGMQRALLAFALASVSTSAHADNGPAFAAIGIVDDAVVRVEPDGQRQTLYQLPVKPNFDAFGEPYGARRTAEYGALIVDETSGRWALPERLKGDDGWRLLIGERDGSVNIHPGISSCRYDTRVSDCRIHVKAFSPDGRYLFVESERLGSSTVYRLDASTPGPAIKLAGPAIANDLTLDFANGRILYRNARGVFGGPWRLDDRTIRPGKLLVAMPQHPPLASEGPLESGSSIYVVDESSVRVFSRGTSVATIEGLAVGRSTAKGVVFLSKNERRELTRERMPAGRTERGAPQILTFRLRAAAGATITDMPGIGPITSWNDVSDDGRTLLVTHHHSNDLYAYDVVTGKERVLIPGFGPEYGSENDPASDSCMTSWKGDGRGRWPEADCGNRAQLVRLR